VAIGAMHEVQVFGPLVKNYTYALVLFALCYRLRETFRSNRVLDFLADISFPLYLVHSMIGYVAMPILIDRGISYSLACLACVGLAIVVACLVHVYVELPANALGRRASRIAPGRVPAGI
jgi:peptidoglycan/LPS O-acetylase OafA/YrhL